MKTLTDLPEIKDKIVFVRCDFNVPIVDKKVGDSFRIEKAMCTINLLREKGAKLILASHIESEEGTLRPVLEYLRSHYPSLPITFVEDYFPDGFDEVAAALEQGNIVLLENLRKYPEEKENDQVFAMHLAHFSHFFVNEAFPAAHRAHASVVGIPKFVPSFAGLVFEEEVTTLMRTFSAPHPFVFILGGAKFETKLPLVEKFVKRADTIFVGGALANDFFKARGIAVGSSLLSKGDFHLERFTEESLRIPSDVVVEVNGSKVTKDVHDLSPADTISDVGPESIEALRDSIMQAKFILWNGPLGNYEKGFKEGTLSLAKLISESSAESIVGGGDTVASIAELNLAEKFSFISTGGGAMLDFLANETLPGIDALHASL